MITVHGIPAHPLVVHAAVVLVPLTAISLYTYGTAGTATGAGVGNIA